MLTVTELSERDLERSEIRANRNFEAVNTVTQEQSL